MGTGSIIYVIINEFTPRGSDVDMTEIVPPARWNYQEALDDLFEIAESAGVQHDGTNVLSAPVEGTLLESDLYYIVELEVCDRG